MAKLININRPFTEYNRAHGTKNTLLDGNDVGDKKNKKLHQVKVLVRRLLVSFAVAAAAGVT